MSELQITVAYSMGTGMWYAMADKNESPQYDSGSAKCISPEAALYALAMELYEQLDRAEESLHPTHG